MQNNSSFQDTEEVNITDKNYSINLSKAVFEAAIPLWKLAHPNLVDFFKTEHNMQLPSHQSLYDNVDKIYMKCVDKRCSEIGKMTYIWWSTKHIVQWANKFQTFWQFPYLFSTKSLEKGTAFLLPSNYIRTWRQRKEIHFEKVLLLVLTTRESSLHG